MRARVGLRVERDARIVGTFHARRIRAAAQRRRDARRIALDLPRITAVRILRRLPARNAGLREHLLQAGRPELEYLRMRALAVTGRARGLAGRIVDHDGPMHGAHADRRRARNEPGPALLRTPFVRQIAAREADAHALQLRRHRTRRLDERALGIQRVDHLEKQRCRGIDADERRVARIVEVADPHDQHVRAECAGRPRIAK